MPTTPATTPATIRAAQATPTDRLDRKGPLDVQDALEDLAAKGDLDAKGDPVAKGDLGAEDWLGAPGGPAVLGRWDREGHQDIT